MSEQPAAENLTIKELEELCGLCFSKRAEIDSMEMAVKEKVAELEALKEQLLHFLTELDKTSYDSSVGKISVKNIFTVALPKTPQAKYEFFEYLKGRGLFEDMVSVHSKTLNSFYKQEQEIANQEQKLDFKIPGLDEPFMKQSLSFKRK